MQRTKPWDALVIGGGVAGLSAAIYLARARREILVIDAGQSLAHWVPDIDNYLGFPHGISGDELLKRGRKQARHYGAEFADGDGATPAQAMNHSLFEEDLQTHSLHRYRAKQLEYEETQPPIEPATAA